MMAGCLGGDSGGENVAPMDLEEWPPQDYSNELYPWSWYSNWNEWGAENFGGEYDVNATPTPFSSPTDWFSKLEAGDDHQVDSVSTNNEWAGRALNNDYLEPLPTDLMPNYQELTPQIRDPVEEHFGTDDGGVYAIPHTAHVTPALCYNTEAFDSPPSSWDVLWDEEYAGEMMMWGGSPDTPCYVGAFYTGQDPLNPDDYDEIREALIQNKDLMLTYGDNYDSARAMFINEEVVAGAFIGAHMHRAVIQEGADYLDFAIPEEGAMWSPNVLAVPADPPNPVTATMYTDFLLGEAAQNEFIDLNMRQPARSGTDWIDQPDDVVERISLDESDYESLKFSAPLDQEVAERYDEIWTEVQAA